MTTLELIWTGYGLVILAALAVLLPVYLDVRAYPSSSVDESVGYVNAEQSLTNWDHHR